MERSIYETMKALEKTYKIYQRENYREDRLKDIYFLGAINVYKEIENTGKTGIEVIDVYVEVEDYSIPVLKFVDKDNNLIAMRKGQLFLPSSEYMWGSIPETEKEKMLDFSFEKDKSLNYTRKKIKEIAKELNISEEKILSIYEENGAITENNKKEEEKEDKKPKDIVRLEGQDKAEKNNTSMDAFTKQETSLDQIVNDGKTLREILNLPPEAQTLVFVETSSIVNDTGIADNTRFTPLYKDIDGNYHRIDELQMAGGNPNRSKVAAVNEHGDNVEYTSVYSMFTTKETSGTQYAITANIGSYGVIDLGIGQVDKTQGINSIENETAVVTTRLKTDSTYYTSRETRERINGERDGRRQATARRDEAKLHEECEHKKDINSVDGKNIEEEKEKEKAKRVDGEISDKEEANKNTIDNTAANVTFRLLQFRPENLLIRKYYQNDNSKLQNKIQEMLKENPDLISLIDNLDDVENTIRKTLNQELLENIEKEEEQEKTIWDSPMRKNNHTA